MSPVGPSDFLQFLNVFLLHLEEMLYGYFGHDVPLEVGPPGGENLEHFVLLFLQINKPPGGEY